MQTWNQKITKLASPNNTSPPKATLSQQHNLLLLLLFILPPSILKILADLLLCVCVHILQGHLSVQVPGCRVHIYMVQVKILLLYLLSFFRQVATEDLHSRYQYDLLG